MRCWVLLAPVTCWLFVSSCGSDAPPDVGRGPTAEPGEPANTAGGNDATATSPSSTSLPEKSPFEYDSPLVDYLGIGSGYSIEAYISLEESISACMREQGFEYTPAPVPVESYGLPAEADKPVFGTDAWVKTYGFGISTQAFSQNEVGPDLVGRPPVAYGSEAEDPNVAYRESLSPEARDAYDRALYGHADDRDRDPGESSRDTSETSCTESATIDNNGGVDLRAFNQLFRDGLVAIDDGVQLHPRVQAARDEAAACLDDMGQDITRFDQAEAAIDEQLIEVLAVNGLQSSGLAPGEGELSQAARDLLGEIQADEIELALAFRECGAPNEALNGVGDPLFNEVRIELEEQFLEDNRDELEAFLLSRDGG